MSEARIQEKSNEDIVERSEDVKCTYNINGICILSDCRCMKVADSSLVCSSFNYG